MATRWMRCLSTKKPVVNKNTLSNLHLFSMMCTLSVFTVHLTCEFPVTLKFYWKREKCFLYIATLWCSYYVSKCEQNSFHTVFSRWFFYFVDVVVDFTFSLFRTCHFPFVNDTQRTAEKIWFSFLSLSLFIFIYLFILWWSVCWFHFIISFLASVANVWACK